MARYTNPSLFHDRLDVERELAERTAAAHSSATPTSYLPPPIDSAPEEDGLGELEDKNEDPWKAADVITDATPSSKPSSPKAASPKASPSPIPTPSLKPSAAALAAAAARHRSSVNQHKPQDSEAQAPASPSSPKHKPKDSKAETEPALPPLEIPLPNPPQRPRKFIAQPFLPPGIVCVH